MVAVPVSRRGCWRGRGRGLKSDHMIIEALTFDAFIYNRSK